MQPIVRLWRYARPFRSDVTLATIYSALNKLFDIAPEVLIGLLVDTVVKRDTSFLAGLGVTDPMHQLVALAGATVVIWVLESTFEYLYSLRWRNLAQAVQNALRLDVYEHVQKLPLAYFEDKSSGQLLSVINDDINQLERFLNGGANDLIQIVVSSLVIGAIFFVLTPGVAVVALIPVPLILLGAFYFQRRLEPRYAEVREHAARLNGTVNNNLAGIATIKAYVAEAHELDNVRTKSAEYQAANAGAIRIASAITPVIRMAVLSGFVATLLYGGVLTLRGTLAVGAYSVLVFLTQRLLWPMTRLADMADLYQRAMASTRRALDLLETPIPIRDGQGQWDTRTLRGELALENVVLRYGEQRALDGVTLRVNAGSTVALVGSTGSGKSSLVKLLLRFYEPQEGQITIDGVPIHTLALSELRRAVGFVSQDVYLVDGTIADNISYGSFDASREEIVRAGRAAEAHEFIARLPEGYDTRVGERGQRLSGGQRQRIAIARALLKDPPILVLDEATSAVDNETEAAIKRSLDTITKGRTTLLVAHRLSTIQKADRICVMEAGRIVEEGSHAELVLRGERYAALWRLQTAAT